MPVVQRLRPLPATQMMRVRVPPGALTRESEMSAKNIVIRVVDSDNEEHNTALIFSDHPPELHLFMLVELFREALRAIYDDKYRLDIIPRHYDKDSQSLGKCVQGLGRRKNL